MNNFDSFFLYTTIDSQKYKCHIQMNLFGQQNDVLVKIVFLIVQYATDHGTLFSPGEELSQIYRILLFCQTRTSKY